MTENIEHIVGNHGNPRTLHEASEPVIALTREGDGAERTAKIRKVAAGPAAPSYKGKVISHCIFDVL